MDIAMLTYGERTRKYVWDRVEGAVSALRRPSFWHYLGCSQIILPIFTVRIIMLENIKHSVFVYLNPRGKVARKRTQRTVRDGGHLDPVLLVHEARNDGKSKQTRVPAVEQIYQTKNNITARLAIRVFIRSHIDKIELG